jgi:hypothetical protein
LNLRRLAFLVALLVLAVAAKPRKEYERVYEAHTRHLVIYQGFATALNIRATYLTPQFRVAFADERARLLGEAAAAGSDEYRRMLLEDGDVYHEVVFSADSSLDEGDTFGTDDDGWRVRLEADGTEETLVTLFKVKDPNPMQRALYPHFNIWSELWIARFAKSVKDPKKIVLYVGSGYGHADIVWRIGPDGAQRGR